MPIFQAVSKLLHRVPHRRIALLIALAAAIIVLGAALFSITQHDTYWLSLYWAITTATTVGYGDVTEAGDLLLQLVEAGGLRLEELIVDADLDRKTLSSARSAAGTLVLGIARDGRVDLGVGDDPTLSAGDRLIVLRDRDAVPGH